VSDTDQMTRREREDLAQLVRRREKVAKTQAQQRSAELLADFEAKLAAEYAYDDDAVWKQAKERADAVVQEAEVQIAARCRELGIPPQFAPDLSLGWYRRGENAVKERRTELRKVATTHIAALERAARSEIERRSVEVQTQLIAGGLTSSAAKSFLESMPTAASLMPPLSVGDVESLRLGVRQARTDQLHDLLLVSGVEEASASLIEEANEGLGT
jgi:hypothetical protein